MRRALATALLALSLGSSAAPSLGAEPAQDQAASLIGSLSRVPLTRDAHESLVGWVDLDAVIKAREGAADPASLAEILALLEARDPAGRLWMAALSGVATGSSGLLTTLFAHGEAWPRTVGFDFTDIDTRLSFGMPPVDGDIFTGSFDPDAIGAALTARDFTSQPADTFTLWCRSDGCDQGWRVDVQGRNLEDPFGGNLGRKQPLAVSRSALLSSAAIETVQGMLDAAADRTPSLADDPFWAGLAGVAASEGTLLQATFLPGTMIAFNPLSVLGERADADSVRELLEEMAETFEPIAPSPLIVFADAATETHQVVTVALAYGSRGDAQRAADVLPRRLDAMQSLRTRQPWSEALADRGVEAIEAEAVDLPTGGAATRLVFRAPLAGPEPGLGGGYVSSSILYRLFVDMIYTRDIDWLVPSLPTFE